MVEKRQILIATPDTYAHESITRCFDDDFYIQTAEDRETSLEHFRKIRFEFAFFDIDIVCTTEEKNISYYDFLDNFWKISADTEIVVLCLPEKVRRAVQIVRAGATAYLIYPIDQAEVEHVIESTREYNRLRLKLDSLHDDFWMKEVDHLVKTDSPIMKKAITAAKSVAQTNSTVCITGETGTGKGILANLIHQHSSRKSGPYISVHCGAIPENLIESELFGHEKGSFTGAVNKKMGKFELASGGTIFLDEVGTMSLGAQVKLLKVLQERTIQRVGSEKDITVDVRVIAAANRDLLKLCEQNEFRSDLYYRLNVFPIELPPLHERKEDIPHLVNVILKRLNASYGKCIDGVRDSVTRGFQQYSWPGNIRELENVIERAYVLENSSYLTPENFPIEIVPFQGEEPMVVVETKGTLAEIRKKGIEEIEKKYLYEKLAENQGRIDKTAAEAGISPRQLNKLMTKYKLKREQFKK